MLERECEGVYGIEKKKYDESMDEEPESDVFNGTERPLSTSFPPSRRGKLESPADGLSAAGSSESKKMRETCVLLLPKYLSISSDFVLLVRPFLIRVAF